VVIHADLGAAAGEQGPPAGQIGAGVALGVILLGAGRAQLVIERVHHGEPLLADVTPAGLPQHARGGATHRTGQRNAGRLVVDPAGRAGRGRLGDRPVRGQDRLAAFPPALLLHRLEQPGGGPPHRHRVGVLRWQPLDLGQHRQAQRQPRGIQSAIHAGPVRAGLIRLSLDCHAVPSSNRLPQETVLTSSGDALRHLS
jgi:hypothetical protein